MRAFFWLSLLLIGVAVLQAALLPSLLPAEWIPDFGLLVALCALVYLPREAGLAFAFAVGVQADLLGAGPFGHWTLAYMITVTVLLSIEREWVAAGAPGAWLAATLGTGLAHGLYVLLGRLWSASGATQAAFAQVGWVTLYALVFGMPLAWAFAEFFAWMGLLRPALIEKRRGPARPPRRRATARVARS